MMLRSRTAQTTILAAGSALAFMTAAVGNHAHAEGKLDASYTISFARIPVGERGGLGCLNSFSASISGASAAVRLPSGVAAG